MSRAIRLAKGLSLPLEIVTQTLAVLARKRSGKSYFARRFAEQIAHARQQLVIVDPKGDWWGIRSSANGKGPGLSIVILGGERGDVPLEPGSGELVAKLAVEERVSLLLDLSLFRKHELATFVAAFLETLYRLKNHERYRTPLTLIIDEADAIAPQKTSAKGGQGGNVERMLGAANDIVRRGGQRGIGCMLVTQRSAVISKDVLTQCEVLIALRTIAPQDLTALMAWVDVHGTPEGRATLKASLPSLPIGDAWVWSPGWPTDQGIFQRIHTLPIETFDSGATPKPGEKRVEPKSLADVDLDALRIHMAETIERAKADDPRELKKRIAELERELKTAKKAQPAPVAPPKEIRVEVPVVHPLAFEHANAMCGSARSLVQEAEQLRTLLKQQPMFSVAPAKSSKRDPHVAVAPNPVMKLAARDAAPKPTNGASELGKGPRIIMTAVAQYPDGVTPEQLSVLTEYTRSSRNTFLQKLGAVGYTERDGRIIRATAAGIEWLGDFEPLPTGDALQHYWFERLPEGQRRVLKVAIATYPKPVAHERIDEVTGYTRSTRNTFIQKLGARMLVKRGRGEITASDELFN